MEFISGSFAFLSIAMFLFAIAGLVKPALFEKFVQGIFKKPATRAATFFLFSAYSFIAFTICLFTLPEDKTKEKSPTSAVQTIEVAETEPKNTSRMPEDSPQIKPENIISFPKSTFICATKDLLGEALLRGAKGEKTKLEAMFKKDPALGIPKCFMADPRIKFKVLSIEKTEALEVLELVLADSKNSDGIWAIGVEAEIHK